MPPRIGRVCRLLPLGWCLILRAQNAPPAPASVSGVVLNSLTGDPILRAHVMLQTMGERMGYSMSSTGVRIVGGDGDSDSKNYGALTNGEGRFSIESVPPGKYYVSAERVGFVAPAGMAIDSNTVVVAPGDKKNDFKLKLIPAGAITGRITDADGEGISNALVIARGTGGDQQEISDEQGRYRVGGLSPGRYRIVAAPTPHFYGAEIRSDGSRQVHLATTYFPDSMTRSGARAIEVAPGAQVSGIDVRLVATPMVFVTGKVAGMPAGKAYVTVEAFRQHGAWEGFGGFGTQTNMKADGTFTLSNLDPGKYDLVALAQGQHGLQSTPVEIEVAGTNIEHLDLRMIAPFEVAGTIHFDEEPAKTEPKARRAPAFRAIYLQPMGAGMPNGNGNAAIAADDSFTLEKVAPGQYHVGISWGPGYVRSVTVGSAETDGDVLDVRNGAPGPVVIAVSSQICEISGTVTDANGPVANAHVVLAPDSSSQQFTRTVQTKPDGTYRFSSLPPGKFKLAATDDAVSFNMMRVSEVLDDYQDVAQSIELHPGDKITQDLKRR